jgi:cell division protein FtsB
MININILPEHLRPIKRSPLPYVVSILFAAVCLLIAGVIFLTTQTRILARNIQKDALENKYKEYELIVKESNDLDEQKKKLRNKIDTIEEIVRDRMIWSRQLWNLVRLAPDNLWYSGFIEDSKEFKSTRIEKDPNSKTGGTRQVNVTYRRPILRVSGYVVTTPELTADVNPFATATETDPEFSKMFSLETTALKETLFEDRPVKNFTLEFQIKSPGQVIESAPAAAGGAAK